MSLYDDASLIMYPSGYKADKIYSLKPTNGSGDLDFTRAGTATRVNSSGFIESVASGVPRLNYPLIDGVVSGCASLLLENSATNLIPYSEDFSNAAWSKEDLTVLPNQAISPDGSLNADLLLPNTNNTDHSIYDQTTASTEIFTVFLKSGGYNFAFLGQNNAADTNGAFFDLINGTISKNSSTLSASIEDYGNGWFRCSLFGSFISDFRIICPSENGQTFSFAGDGAKGVYSWGAQCESSNSSTSYIPTSGSQTTRVAETASKTGISSLIGQTEGTMFAEFVAQPTPTLQSHIWLGTPGTEIGLYGDSKLIFFSSAGVSIIGPDLVAGARYKISFAYKANDYVAYINGVKIGVNTSAPVPATSSLYINSFSDFSGVQKKEVSQVQLFKTRLSNTELQTLTTI